MRVLRNDPPRAEQEGEDGFVSLDTIAKEADIITLHVPLTKEGRFATRHLADHAFSTSWNGSLGLSTVAEVPYMIRRPYCRPNEPARSAN